LGAAGLFAFITKLFLPSFQNSKTQEDQQYSLVREGIVKNSSQGAANRVLPASGRHRGPGQSKDFL
jgi:hypothetical protein